MDIHRGQSHKGRFDMDFTNSQRLMLNEQFRIEEQLKKNGLRYSPPRFAIAASNSPIREFTHFKYEEGYVTHIRAFDRGHLKQVSRWDATRIKNYIFHAFARVQVETSIETHPTPQGE